MPDKNKVGPKRIVLVGGCFDILHFGHISFLTSAKNLGDKLVVALESDESVRRKKGPSRPIHPQSQRRQMLQALSVVDEVIALPELNSDNDYFELVMRIKPDVIAVTEGDPVLDRKKLQAKQAGADLQIIAKIHTPSTSQLTKLLGLET